MMDAEKLKELVGAIWHDKYGANDLYYFAALIEVIAPAIDEDKLKDLKETYGIK
jgi:hypothetical protein